MPLLVICFQYEGEEVAWFSSREFFDLVKQRLQKENGNLTHEEKHSLFLKKNALPGLRHRMCSFQELETLKKHKAVPPSSTSATLMDGQSMVTLLHAWNQTELAEQLSRGLANFHELFLVDCLNLPDPIVASDRTGSQKAPLTSNGKQNGKRKLEVADKNGSLLIKRPALSTPDLSLPLAIATLPFAGGLGRVDGDAYVEERRASKSTLAVEFEFEAGDGYGGCDKLNNYVVSRMLAFNDVKGCAFCALGFDASTVEALGAKEGPHFVFNANRWVHRQCSSFASAVRLDDEGRSIGNVVAEIKRGRKLKCVLCRKAGGVSGCAVGKCRHSYHLPCARKVGCQETTNYTIYCPNHSYKPSSSSHKHSPSSSSSDAQPFLPSFSNIGANIPSQPCLDQLFPELSLLPTPTTLGEALVLLDALQANNASKDRRMKAVLLKHRHGIDVSAKLQHALPPEQSAENLITASCERWRQSHLAGVRGRERAGEVLDPNVCPRSRPDEYVPSAGKGRGGGHDEFWGSAIEFPLAKSDHRWLAQMTEGEWVRLRASVRQFLKDTQYWQNRKGHGRNVWFPEDGELDYYIPAPNSADEHMLGWCRVQLLTKDYFLPDMAGERGVVAGSRTIPKFTVLTRYMGAISSALDFDQSYRGTNQECKRDNYSVSVLLSDPSEPEPVELVVDGLHGGLGSCFNDYRHNIEAGQDHANDFRMHNIQLTQINVCGDPMVLVVAKQDILPHAHMLLDYGDLFWNRFREDREREQLAMSQYDALVRIATDPDL